MTSFHIRVKDSIQSIGSWEETIQRINELNDLLLKALKKRSKYPVCRDYFENTPKKELREKGIDDILWDSFYSKIVEKICPEGDYVEGVVKKEAELEELLHERVQIGEKVIAYKAPRGKQITRKPRALPLKNSICLIKLKE